MLPKNTWVKLSGNSEPTLMHTHEDPIRVRYMFYPLLNYFVFWISHATKSSLCSRPVVRPDIVLFPALF